VDFDDLQINVSQILARLNLEGEVIQNEFVGPCMFHRESGNPNLEINIVTGLWHCWVCGEKGNLPVLVMRLLGSTYREAVDIISDYGSVLNIAAMRKRNLAELALILNPVRHHFTSVSIEEYSKGRSWWWHNGIPYGRFSRGIVRRFDLGYDGASKRAVIPVRASNKWVGLIRRAVNETQHPRYLYSAGFDRRYVLYGLPYIPTASNSCVVVEGAKDALRAYQYGHDNFVASLGTGLTSEQLTLLEERFDDVTVFCDNDAPGHIAQLKMCQDLAQRVARVYVVEWHTNRKDPNELTAEEMRRMLDRKIHWTRLIDSDYVPARSMVRDSSGRMAANRGVAR
jgi:DNA primase